MEKGILIVFEGLDYSFKETNSKRLYEYIKSVTDKVELLSFPNYESESSIFVKNYLSGKYGKASEVDPYQSSMFYAMDRYDTIHSLNIKEKLEDGYIIIMDRYIGSNLIFQSTKFDDNVLNTNYIQSMSDFEYHVLGLPKEDLVIYMNMPIEVSHELMKERKLKSGEDTDGHEDNYQFMKSVEANAEAVINRLGCEIVNCVNEDNTIRTEEEIFNDILAKVENTIDEKFSNQLSKLKVILDSINNKVEA